MRETLIRKRERGEVARDASAMRKLIASEKGDKDVWDLKLVKGGLHRYRIHRAISPIDLRP